MAADSTLPMAPAKAGPTRLHADDGHEIYWLGIEAETAFRCNAYLIRDGEAAYLVDPGSRATHGQVRERVAAVMAPERVSGVILCHQDPDVAASLVDWLAINPELTVVSSPRTRVLLPHYGVDRFDFHDIEATPALTLPSGAALRFVTAPFLHSPMAFTTYDSAARFLFTGDIFAALESDWRLVVEDFTAHVARMDLFHVDYMACNAAARGFVAKLEGLAIDALLPQHGSIIPQRFVAPALEYLETLQCGLDLLYPDLL